MKNFIEDGRVMSVTNGTGATVVAGGGILVGALIAIALSDIANGASGPAKLDGVFSHAKNTGASTGGAQGVNAYWDNTNKKFTAVASGNTLVGKFFATCLDADATAQVLLNV